MPRQRGGAAAPRRPSTAPPPKQAATPVQQQRSASTASVPVTVSQPHQPAPLQQAQAPPSQGPGLFGQMASTAAGVALGSTVGHMAGAAISGLFGGSSSSPPAEASPQAATPTQDNSANSWGDRSVNAICEADVKNLRKCLDENKGDMSICGYYLDQLKACQNMARQAYQ